MACHDDYVPVPHACATPWRATRRVAQMMISVSAARASAPSPDPSAAYDDSEARRAPHSGRSRETVLAGSRWGERWYARIGAAFDPARALNVAPVHAPRRVVAARNAAARRRRLDDYEWIDGELFGGLVLGWNFGDGHVNDLQLLRAVQAQCAFSSGPPGTDTRRARRDPERCGRHRLRRGTRSRPPR